MATIEQSPNKGGLKNLALGLALAVGTGLLFWGERMRFPDWIIDDAILDSIDRGLIEELEDITVHHLIPAEVGRNQGIDRDVIVNPDNALAIPEWIHVELHKLYTNEELASMGLEGTIEAIEKIRQELGKED